jgi:hypothetical protein
MPDGVFKAAAAEVRLLRGPTAYLVLNQLDVPDCAGPLLGNERAAEALVPHQVGGDMAKLRRKVLVDEQDVHGASASSEEGTQPRLDLSCQAVAQPGDF